MIRLSSLFLLPMASESSEAQARVLVLPGFEKGGALLEEWVYEESVHEAVLPRFHMNLWLFQGKRPQKGFEAVIQDFVFTPQAP